MKLAGWSLTDFLIMSFLLLYTGLVCDLVLRRVDKIKHWVMLCTFFVAILIIIWAEMAVGIFWYTPWLAIKD